MRRIEAIENILTLVEDTDVIISCNGMISRELYHLKDRPRNFYMLGSMGCALGIGIGLAYTRPDLTVIVINGDGNCLMEYGSTVLMENLCLPNLRHYVLDNNSYATTGGKTCSEAMEVNKTIVSDEYGDAPRIPLSPVEIKERFIKSICKTP